MSNSVNYVLFNLLFLWLCHYLSLNWTPRTFPRACIGTSALSTQRQAATMTNATVRAEVHQTLDIHRNFTSKITFNFELRNCRPEVCNLWLCEILDRRVRSYISFYANLFRARIADTENRSQSDYDVLIQRNIYACYTCHLYLPHINLDAAYDARQYRSPALHPCDG